MSNWRLDLNEYLYLQTNENISSGAFYKLTLKRYVSSITEGFICFKPNLTYLEYKRIIALCQKETAKRNLGLDVSLELANFIQTKEMHLETRLKLGIEIKTREDKLLSRFESYKQIVDNKMKRPLREKQMWDSFFMYAMKKSGNFSVPGSGKTASVLGMYAYLKSQGLVNRIVVVSPKNAFGSWIDEFEVCLKEELRAFNIHAGKKAALRLGTGVCNLFLFNYESLGSIVEEVKTLASNALLVFDEVHKVKKIDGIYAAYAINVAKNANHVVAMTGTPIPNAYTDIYNFLNILFPDEYREFFGFSPALLRNPSPAERDNINDKLQPFFCRTTKKELQVPDANKNEIVAVYANEIENRLLKILKMRYRNNKLALIIRIMQLETNPQMLLKTLDLRDFRYLIDDEMEIDEIDTADYSGEVEELINSCAITTKFHACLDKVLELVAQNKPVIVWCMFIDSINRIAQALETCSVAAKCIYGEVPLDERQQILTDFKSGQFKVLLTNPHTLAESVSLHGICHDAIYFEYSYNLIHLLQSKDRIHRLGLSQGQYTQYYFCQTGYATEDGEWSLGEVIYNRLLQKEQIMLDAIDNHVLEVMPTTEDDLTAIFG